MEYRRFRDTFYARLDKDDEIIGALMDICRKEGIQSATFSGIGGCASADIQTFIPETGTFETQHIEGMLELISVMGNIISDEAGTLYHHTHALFSYKDAQGHHQAAGHMKAITVLYTAEIELRPVWDGAIHRQYDPETGTGFWKLY